MLRWRPQSAIHVNTSCYLFYIIITTWCHYMFRVSTGFMKLNASIHVVSLWRTLELFHVNMVTRLLSRFGDDSGLVECLDVTKEVV